MDGCGDNYRCVCVCMCVRQDTLRRCGITDSPVAASTLAPRLLSKYQNLQEKKIKTPCKETTDFRAGQEKYKLNL